MYYPRVFAIAIVLSVTGCATTLHKGPAFSPLQTFKNKALVYLYRPGNPPFWRTPSIILGKQKIAELYNHSYTYVYATPGEYTIKTDWSWNAGVPDIEETITFEANKTYYIRLGGDMRFSGPGIMVQTSSTLGTVSYEKAMSEITQCSLVQPHRENIGL